LVYIFYGIFVTLHFVMYFCKTNKEHHKEYSRQHHFILLKGNNLPEVSHL